MEGIFRKMNSLEACDIDYEFVNDEDMQRYLDFMKDCRKIKRDIKRWFIVLTLSIPILNKWRLQGVYKSAKK